MVKTVTDEWNSDGHTYTRTYTEEEIMYELNDIWGSEEYQNNEDWIHLREEHLTELLRQISPR